VSTTINDFESGGGIDPDGSWLSVVDSTGGAPFKTYAVCQK
jgi:hypothetical protein